MKSPFAGQVRSKKLEISPENPRFRDIVRRCKFIEIQVLYSSILVSMLSVPWKSLMGQVEGMRSQSLQSFLRRDVPVGLDWVKEEETPTMKSVSDKI